MTNIEKLNEYIKESKNIVFFGGAGVSTESGIPDFRSANGIYNKYNTKISPEDILSHNFFYQHPRDFYSFYKDKMLYLDVEPNITHYKLAELERKGKLSGIVTQNIDGLHQKAGSNNVIELHGTIHDNYCVKCGKHYDVNKIVESKDNYPLCDCGYLIRPDVTLYDERLNMEKFNQAIDLISKADMLIIGGTSLTVMPACNLIYDFCGDHLVIINKSSLNEKSMINPDCDIIFNCGLGEVFSQIEI